MAAGLAESILYQSSKTLTHHSQLWAEKERLKIRFESNAWMDPAKPGTAPRIGSEQRQLVIRRVVVRIANDVDRTADAERLVSGGGLLGRTGGWSFLQWRK